MSLFRLTDGDEVAIVAPAGRMRSADEHLVAEAARLLASWGLRPRVAVEDQGYLYLAGRDGRRLEEVSAALADDQVRAVFCTRGGYGSQRLLRSLNWTAVDTNTLLVGFSDITALHLAAQASGHEQVHLVHGPNVATNQLLASTSDAEANRQELRNCLFEPTALELDAHYLVEGSAQGDIVGGCLSIITSQIGTPYLPTFDGKVLFLEDVGEVPYKVDRMLTHLRHAGSLDNVAGIVFGEMHNCTDPHNRLEDVIVDALEGLDVPVAFGVHCGHGSRNTSIRLGSRTHLNSTRRSINVEP